MNHDRPTTAPSVPVPAWNARAALAALFLTVAAPAARADVPAAAPEPSGHAAVERTQGDPSPVLAAPHVRRRVTPLTTALDQVMDREMRGLAVLRARFAQARSHAEALVIQREIESLKKETELALLRVQIDFARREGRMAMVAEIESAIERILHPPVPPPAVSRPSPEAAGQRAH